MKEFVAEKRATRKDDREVQNNVKIYVMDKAVVSLLRYAINAASSASAF
jgi:hypothetical protein